MSPFWEKMFYIGSFLAMGSSYMSANAFGAMHRLHHFHADMENDPHSPRKSPGLIKTIIQSRNSYYAIFCGDFVVEDKITKGLPNWKSFDSFAHNWIVRFIWIFIYVLIYINLATEWWMFLFLPITVIMAALQGGIINWWAHTYGYRNFEIANDSKNILRIDLFFWGESYHNNHHKYPGKLNTAIKWFEFDLGYYAILLMSKFHIVKIRT
ncbi:MAG: fatty acid desaturase [Daejeonella sp.]